MENLMKHIAVMLFFFLGCYSYGQEAFYKTFSGSLFDEGQGLVQLADSGYLITGSTAGFSGSADAYLMRIDKFGNQEWTKSYGGENSDWGRRVFYEQGVGFWCMGYTNSLDAESFDFYVFKTDELGELEWEKTIGTLDWDRLWDAKRLPNGDFILVGETFGSASQNEDILVVRIDDAGNELWTERIQTSGNDIPHSLSVLNDTTVIIAGESYNGTNQCAFLLSMDINGATNWLNFYEPSLRGVFYGADIFNNEIYAVGGLIAADQTTPDLWMIRADSDGVVLIDYIDELQEIAYFSNIKVMGSGRLYVSLISDSPDLNPFTDGVDLLVLKYYLNLIWNGFSHRYSGVNDDISHQMIGTNDNGIALVGTVSDDRVNNSSGTDVTVIKIGENDEVMGIAEEEDLLYVLHVENNSFEVYPNPMTNELVITIPNDKLVEYTFFSTVGRVQLSGSLSGGKIDVSVLPTGLYLLQLKCGNEYRTVKLVK